MKLAERLPKGLYERLAPRIERIEAFVRDFEWTWTKAVVAALVLWFIAIGSLAILPSWWLYFADQKLKWSCPPLPGTAHFFLCKLRDVIASGAFGTPFLIMIVAPYFIQKWRRRLRSESERRPTGGYR
jgi:hypothetical protein